MTQNIISKKGYFKLVEKKSSFYAYCLPIENEQDVKEIISKIKNKHKAKHYPYAYHITLNNEVFEKKSDDGEPSSTAGLPFKNLILKHNLTNTILIVARVFGGVKLGTSGLRQAFKESAEKAIENATIKEI